MVNEKICPHSHARAARARFKDLRQDYLYMSAGMGKNLFSSPSRYRLG
jgi:hypothetical protein